MIYDFNFEILICLINKMILFVSYVIIYANSEKSKTGERNF